MPPATMSSWSLSSFVSTARLRPEKNRAHSDELVIVYIGNHGPQCGNVLAVFVGLLVGLIRLVHRVARFPVDSCDLFVDSADRSVGLGDGRIFFLFILSDVVSCLALVSVAVSTFSSMG